MMRIGCRGGKLLSCGCLTRPRVSEDLFQIQISEPGFSKLDSTSWDQEYCILQCSLKLAVVTYAYNQGAVAELVGMC